MKPDRNLVDMTGDEIDEAVAKTAEFLKATKEQPSSVSYGDLLVQQVQKCHPDVTAEEILAELEALG